MKKKKKKKDEDWRRGEGREGKDPSLLLRVLAGGSGESRKEEESLERGERLSLYKREEIIFLEDGPCKFLTFT
jgi:hypothetical protein